MTEQGPPAGRPSAGDRGGPPARSGRHGRASVPRPSWDDYDTGDDLPPWAGLGIEPRRARSGTLAPGTDLPAPREGEGSHAAGRDGEGHRRSRGGRSFPVGPGFRQRLAAARVRRARRTMIIWAAAVAAVIAAAVVLIPRLLPHHKPATVPGLVTTFQRGEFKTVPAACSAVSPATLSKYVPGRRHVVVPQSLNGKSESMCDWSVDAPPVYRLLEVTVQAYSPSGLASGTGSATFAAMDGYRQAMQAKAHPSAASRQPPATVTRLAGIGNSAFSALQVLKAGGDTTDLVTVAVRDRNVLITVVFDGLAHSGHGRYGPVPVPELKLGAEAAARDVLSRIR
ncbi:MAG: hypothetical protein J2P35_22605 [Actinobacteria bacterium]|nr:hypothetical protein [Actinomycetota bacterium]